MKFIVSWRAARFKERRTTTMKNYKELPSELQNVIEEICVSEKAADQCIYALRKICEDKEAAVAALATEHAEWYHAEQKARERAQKAGLSYKDIIKLCWQFNDLYGK